MVHVLMGGARASVQDRTSAHMFASMRTFIILLLMASSVANNAVITAGASGETSALRMNGGTTLTEVKTFVRDAPQTAIDSGPKQLKQAGIWISTWYALEGNYIWAKDFAPQQHVSTHSHTTLVAH